MGIFRRNDDGVTDDDVVARDHVVEDRRGDWGGPPLVRALFTLLGVAVAGLLIWVASQFIKSSPCAWIIQSSQRVDEHRTVSAMAPVCR